MQNRILNTDEAAAVLGVAAGTLKWWRRLDRGPRWWRIGNRVVYDELDVAVWLSEQKATTGGGGR